jgi:asparagine synthase (glutamine-hydrolysing)
LVLGCCTSSSQSLVTIAVRVAAGDFAALGAVDGSRVVIAVRPDDVVVVGDLAGQCVVFYAQLPDGTVVVGSHAGGVAQEISAGVDREWLATRLLLPDVSDVWWTGSPWYGVQALRPGWMLRATRTGHALVSKLVELPLPDKRIEEAGYSLREALLHGVHTRVAESARPTVDLSGGLDSSTVAVLASSRADGPVPAITLTVPGVDDADVAAEIAGQVPGLAYEQWAVPDSALPYSGLESLPHMDEPADIAVSSALIRWWMQRVAHRGSDLHLSGDGGDGVLLAVPTYLGDLATGRQMRDLWHHANGWARLRHQAPQSLIRAAVRLRHTDYRKAVRDVATRLDCGTAPSTDWARRIAWLGHSAISEWTTPEARGMVAARLRQHADEHASPIVPGNFGIGDATAWLSLSAYARSHRFYIDLAAEQGVNHQTPYLDDSVIRACWSVPAWQRTTPDRVKPLLQKAVGNLVPSVLVNRRTKGDYTASSYRGLHRNARFLVDLFTNSRLGELRLIDEAAVRDVVRRGAAGAPIRIGAFDMLVGTEVWLRARDQASTSPEPTERDERASSR